MENLQYNIAMWVISESFQFRFCPLTVRPHKIVIRFYHFPLGWEPLTEMTLKRNNSAKFIPMLEKSAKQNVAAFIIFV